MSEEKKPPRAQIFRYFRFKSRNTKTSNLWMSLNWTSILHKKMWRLINGSAGSYFLVLRARSLVEQTGASFSFDRETQHHPQLVWDGWTIRKNGREIRKSEHLDLGSFADFEKKNGLFSEVKSLNNLKCLNFFGSSNKKCYSSDKNYCKMILLNKRIFLTPL